MDSQTKILARVKCKVCKGKGEIKFTDGNYSERVKPNGLEICYWCDGKGYNEEWIGIDRIVTRGIFAKER